MYFFVYVNGVFVGDNVLDGGVWGFVGWFFGFGWYGCVKRLLLVLKRNEFWVGGGVMVMVWNEEGIVGGKKFENFFWLGKELCMWIVGVCICGLVFWSLVVEEWWDVKMLFYF